MIGDTEHEAVLREGAEKLASALTSVHHSPLQSMTIAVKGYYLRYSRTNAGWGFTGYTGATPQGYRKPSVMKGEKP